MSIYWGRNGKEDSIRPIAQSELLWAVFQKVFLVTTEKYWQINCYWLVSSLHSTCKVIVVFLFFKFVSLLVPSFTHQVIKAISSLYFLLERRRRLHEANAECVCVCVCRGGGLTEKLAIRGREKGAGCRKRVPKENPKHNETNTNSFFFCFVLFLRKCSQELKTLELSKCLQQKWFHSLPPNEVKEYLKSTAKKSPNSLLWMLTLEKFSYTSVFFSPSQKKKKKKKKKKKSLCMEADTSCKLL